MFINTLRTRVIGKQPADTVEWNIRYLYLEILFASIMGAIITYNNLFAVRLGATTALIGALASIPALVMAVTSIPAARMLEGKTNRKAWLLGSLTFIRLGHLVIVILPIIAPHNTAFWLVAWIIVLNVPTAFFTNGFNAMLGELVPERRRAFVFSRRTIIYSLATVVVLALAGRYLDATADSFPVNYQLMYLFGVITVMGSQYYLLRLVVPQSAVIPLGKDKPAVQRTPLSRPMQNMLVNMFVYQLGMQISGPLFIIYYANNLRASDGMISVNSAAGTLGVVFGLVLWERLLRKRSYGWAMRTAMLGTWMFPFVVGVTQDFTLVIIANFIVNLLHPGVDLSTLNVILNIGSPTQRNMNLSYYTTVTSISAFVAPLAAVPLADKIGIPGVMIIAAVLRLAGGMLFRFNPVEVGS